MRGAPERELRLDVEPGFAMPDLGGSPLELRTFTSTYYDTPDRRLLRCGITLRRRVENRIGVWQLALPSEEEGFALEERGGPSPVPAALLGLLPAVLRGGAEPAPVAKLRTTRSGSTVRRGGERVEVVLDSVAVLEGTRIVGRFAELEAESVTGNGTALAAIGKELRRAGARPGIRAPKLARVLGDDAPTNGPADADPAARLRSLLLAQYREVIANDPGVRLGGDPEALHRARVATRRARALLRAAPALVETTWAEHVRAELAWIGGLLGSVRDLDVLLAHLAVEAASLDSQDARGIGTIRSRLGRQRSADRKALLGAMSEPRYLALLDTLAGAGDAPVGEGDASLDGIAERAFRRARKAGRALPPDPGDADLHRVRIATKRARYAAELAEPVLGKAGTRLIRAAKDVQDVIGAHQDACVAEARIRELAVTGSARPALAAGRLVERQNARKRAARRAFPPAWRRFSRAGRAAFA